jgi:hypothetical protein
MRSSGPVALSWLTALLVLIGCGESAPAEAPPADPAAGSAPAPTEAPTPAGSEAPPAAPPEPAAALPELELLHAVPSRVAVSSAYRDDATQVGRLVDGDLETAWNSRTGDLVGAWIELELPTDVAVRAIAITPGFTHVTPRADLFPGNHRVSRVRIHRDGAVLAEHDLDVERREPIELPVHAGGGRYRIEVLTTVPGTRTDWQETCVSELQVLGTAPLGRAGSSSPVTSVGELAGSLEDVELAAEAAADGALDAELVALNIEEYGDLLTDWAVYVAGLSPELDQDEFEEESRTTPESRERIYGERHGHFHYAAGLLQHVDAARAQAMEERASHPDGLWAGRVEDLEALLDGYEAMFGPARRCDAAALRAHASAQTLRSLLDTYIMLLDVDLEGGYYAHGSLSSARRAALRDARTAAQALLTQLGRAGVREDAESLPARGRTVLLESAEAGPPALASDWASTRRELERARDCH